MPSNHLILCLSLLLLPSIFPNMRVFSNESVLPIRPKYWSSSSASVLPMNIQNFRNDWLDSPCSPRDSQVSSPTPQFKSINSSALRLLYSPTLTSIHDYWKTIALTRRTFVGKVMSLLFNILSRSVIAFLPRRKCLLISLLWSSLAVILEPKKIVSHSFHCFPIYLQWSDGTGCHDLTFLSVGVLHHVFHSPLSLSSRASLVLLHFLP